MRPDGRILIAFDSECLMCSRSIRWLAEHDPLDRFRFTPLQSPLGQALESQAGLAPLSSALVEADGQVHSRSTAVLFLLHSLGGPFRLAALLGKCIPRPLRDAAYDFIATRRHHYHRHSPNCPLPSAALRRRLID